MITKFIHVVIKIIPVVTNIAQVLSNAVGLVGDDSDEYELLGGTKASERKRPVRKPKAAN